MNAGSSSSAALSNIVGNYVELNSISEDHRRIWVGNLDACVTENYWFQLLKLMQKCGDIEKFDMLFHKGGPMVGQTRGYAFVTFTHNKDATNALSKLDGTNVGCRSLVVRLAKNIKYGDLQPAKRRIEIPALGSGRREEKLSKSEAIRVIEAKLKCLDRQKDDNLKLNTTLCEPNVPIIQRYQFNKTGCGIHGKFTKTKSSAQINRPHFKRF